MSRWNPLTTLSRSLVVASHHPIFTARDVAPAATQAQRLAICAVCQHNVAGRCNQCCGGVPIPTLIQLAASRCKRGKW